MVRLKYRTIGIIKYLSKFREILVLAIKVINNRSEGNIILGNDKVDEWYANG